MPDSEVTTALTETIAAFLKPAEPRSDGVFYLRDADELAAHLAAVLASSFVVLPKDQLHRETRIAEVIKTEMHRNVPERMRLLGIPEWIDRAAAAVLASLELHQEWTVQGICKEGDDCDHFGEHGEWVCGAIAETREEAAAFPVANVRGAQLVSRLVGSWGPVTDKEQG